MIKSTGMWYQVKVEGEGVIACRMIGKFRLNGRDLTNPVAVGDRVRFEVDPKDQSGSIKEILPRKNYVVRQSPRRKHALHLLASNIDQALLMVTIVEPKLKQGFIDRFLMMVEPYDIPTHILFNKADVYNQEDLEIFAYFKSIYEEIGYGVHLIAATQKKGIEEIYQLLKGKISLIGGQSGVGKSTTVNALIPDLDLKIKELSDYSGKGQHTTTFAEMHFIDDQTAIIDTPGIKTLSFNHLEPMDVAHNFKEFFHYSKDCKFGGNCLHRNEPGCAVKAAIELDEISPFRYENYLLILNEIEEINHWERKGKY